jgi:hypothetical protein
MIIKKILLVILFSLVSYSVQAKDNGCLNKEINPDVQLQNNGWIKIVSQYIEEITPERFYETLPMKEQIITSYKDMVKRGLVRDKIIKLHIKIQFLQPCKATTDVQEWVKKQNPSGDPNAFIQLKDEHVQCLDLFAEWDQANKNGNKEKEKEIIKKSNKLNCTEYQISRFQCDYRLKVFLTTFNNDSDTKSFYPVAPIMDMTVNPINNKSEMLPGETMWIEFIITDNATSWCVWVPK